MKILGISAFFHDSAAALIIDGKIIAAVQEERFTRAKHDSSFPKCAIAYCLAEAGIKDADLDYVVFYDNPTKKFKRILATVISYAPHSKNVFTKSMPQWLGKKLFLKKYIKKELSPEFTGKIEYVDHHISHAASAFYPSPYNKAAVLTIDGVGEWATATIGVGAGNKLKLIRQMNFPHSVGLLYSAFTSYCGFRVNSGEYKLMGLAPYGRPLYADRIKEKLLKIYDDGSIFLNMDYFSFCTSMQMTSEKFHQLFEGKPRTSESEITDREMNLAASIQAVTEEIVLKMAQHAKKLTGKNKLVMAGGVALNCVANGKLQKSGIFDDIFIAPASGDAGGALGAAYYIWHEIEGNKRLSDEKNDKQFGSLLGPAYSDDEIKEFLHANEIPYHYSEGDTVYATAAAELAAEKVIGWFHGRMEFGPRALGGRSIIGDARSPKMQEIMNLKIKYRESFRPFAPSVLQERSSEYFDLQCESPYMLMVAQVQQEKLLELSKEQKEILENDKDLCKRVNLPRSVVPAITHVDNSARVQTVNEKQSPDYYKLLKNFESITGSPVIINTSFNIRGEPIVCTPEDAFRCFMNTEMDVLVLESCVLYKSEMPKEKKDVENYKSNFALD